MKNSLILLLISVLFVHESKAVSLVYRSHRNQYNVFFPFNRYVRNRDNLNQTVATTALKP